MSSSRERYIPALGYRFLTPLYDPIVALTCRERAFKGQLLKQAGIRSGNRVLDLGCGTGTFAIQIKQAIPGAEVTSIDGESEVLNVAKEKAIKTKVEIEFKKCLSTNLPFPDQNFDTIVSSLFFHHLSKSHKIKTVEEVFRVIKGGGQFHIADWGKPTNRFMRFLFYSVQILDGFDNTTDNVKGYLPEILKERGFNDTKICENFSTIFGTMTLYRAIKPKAI